jgi:hypothetical protein
VAEKKLEPVAAPSEAPKKKKQPMVKPKAEEE